MKNSILQTALDDLNVPSFIRHADDNTLARLIATIQTEDTSQPAPERLPRYALIYERQGLDIFKRFVAGQEGVQKEDVFACFRQAFICWRTLALLPDESQQSVNGHLSSQGIRLVKATFIEAASLAPELSLAFRLAIAGLLGGRVAEARLDLRRFSLSVEDETDISWSNLVIAHIFSAFARLVRKNRGWEDVHQALSSISILRKMQNQYEEKYLEQSGDEEGKVLAALELAGLYNLAQLITLVGEYLQRGQPGSSALYQRLNRHYEQALDALEEGGHSLLAHLADLLWAGCRELVQNAIWTHTAKLGKLVRTYVETLTSQDRDRPVIELWPGQQEALDSHLLDPYRHAVLVQMPTSAGKTLLAKFTILQTKALNPDGLVAYIVPTRALVNQVTLDLKMDFQRLLIVEQTVPVFELDPTEEKLLKSKIDVLVTTPEKLDLLVRSDHPVVRDVVLIVADEAHNISDGERGARLELLLGTMKRDFADVHFLLLSPFLPNAQDLAQWLGDGLSSTSIKVAWKPNSKLIGTISCVNRPEYSASPRPLMLSLFPDAASATKRKLKSRDGWALEFESLASIHNDIRGGMKIVIARSSSQFKSVYALSKATARALVNRGTVLVLCWGRRTAEKRAIQIAEDRPPSPSNDRLQAVCRYVEVELGKNCDLAYCLRRGVAYHHSGLSQETRWLIEELIRERLVEIVCGTTTLAQGVNFPITTVIVEDLRKGQNGKLSVQDFLNIAGRAGRALVDTLGVVVFPTTKDDRQKDFVRFLQDEAEEVTSQLISLIEQLNSVDVRFNLHFLSRNPGWSPLLQFLAHAMRVSGKKNLADEVEDLLRASLVYHQVQKQNRQLARRLINICRSYIEQTNEHKNILQLADKTGFATPSVLSLLRKKRNHQTLANESDWRPERLFGDDLQPLTTRVELIADLPEINLAHQAASREISYSADSVAAMLRDWVNGKTIEEMAHIYGKHVKTSNKQITDFARDFYTILDRASWGIGSLETICMSGDEAIDWNKIGYVPSMIYFGVPHKEAVWLRMVGVPRAVAGNLAQLWQQKEKNEPSSYDAVRSWVANLSDNDWRFAIPPESSLTPGDMRLIWQSLSGY